MAYALMKVLQDCRKQKNPALARRAHLQICSIGLEANPTVGNYLVPTFVDCGSLIDAEKAFVKLIQRDEISWTSIIRGFTESGRCLDAFDLFHSMQSERVPANAFTFRALIKACSRLRALDGGHCVYMEIVKDSCESDSFLGNALVDLYAKCGSLVDAQGVFDKLEHRDVVTWTSLIGGYREGRHYEEVLRCWDQMQQEKVFPNAVTYASVLSGCGSMEALDKGCEIHSDAVKDGFDQDSFVGNALIDMYGKHGSLLEAKEVLDEMLVKDVVSWTTLIMAYAKCGFFDNALECLLQMKEGGVSPNLVCWNTVISEYAERGLGEEALLCVEKMEQENLYPDIVILTSITKACGKAKCIGRGRAVHSQIMKMGCEKETFVGNALVDMYGKCDSLDEARGTFDRLENRDIVSWTSLISSNAEHGLIEEANDYLSEMQQTGIPITITTWNAVIAAFAEVGLGEEALKCFSELQSQRLVSPDEVTYACILKACGRIGAINCGRDIHAEVVNAGFESDPFVAGSLIDMYAKCSTLGEAQEVFSKVLVKDSVLWSIVITAYADHGLSDEVLKCVQQMQCDCVSSSISSVHSLRACDNIGDIMLGHKLHSELVKQGLDSDISIRNALISMYANHCRFLEAHYILDHLSNDVITWNPLIAAYSVRGIGSEKIKKCLERMNLDGITPDSTTHCWSLKCAASFEFHLSWGREIHREIVKAGFEMESSTCASLVEMYANHGSFAEAHNVVNRLSIIDDAAWMALCSGYARNMFPNETLNCLEKMQEEECCMKSDMFVMGLKACGALRSLVQGHELHSSLVKHGFDTHCFINNTIINMYGRCASLVEARHVFDNMLVQDIVSWNALITGYVENGLAEEALNCFASMEAKAVKVDRITLISVLKVCGSLGMAEKGRETHTESIKYGLESECDANAALIDMYAKCGLPKEASAICNNRQTVGDAVSLTAIISGYACYGEVDRVLGLVGKMRSKGIGEDGITMLSVLTSCCHAGRMEMGHKYLEGVMEQKRAFLADEHYNGLIDLAARAGQLSRAMAVIESMPLQPKLMMWISLLGACRKWGNVELGRHAFAFAAELSAVVRQASAFVLMANMHQDPYHCICEEEEEDD